MMKKRRVCRLCGNSKRVAVEIQRLTPMSYRVLKWGNCPKCPRERARKAG